MLMNETRRDETRRRNDVMMACIYTGEENGHLQEFGRGDAIVRDRRGREGLGVMLRFF